MANETERVNYEFTGDVSSLSKATKSALSLLDKFESAMDALKSTGNFNPSIKTEKSFNASINRMMKDITGLQKKLKSVGDIKLPKGSSSNKAMSDTIQILQNQLAKLSTSDNVTTKSLNAMRTAINAVDKELKASVPQVGRLVAEEQRFQNTLGVVQARADSFRNKMTAMKSGIAGTFEPITARLRSLSGVFDNIGAKIQSFKDKAATSFGRVSQLASAAASAFRRTSQEADKGDDVADSSASAHKRLASVLDRIRSSFTRETKAITEEETKLKKKNKTTDKSSSSHQNLGSTIRDLGQRMQTESARINQFTSRLMSMNSVSKMAKSALSALGAVSLGNALALAAKESINFTEAQNLFNVAMGSSVGKGREFVRQMQEIYGLDPKNVMQYAGYFYQLTDAIGMSEDASAQLSLSMTKAANDLASYINLPIKEVVDDLASGMQGMTRSVRKYGMDIRATTLQQTALKYGIQGEVESMSEANRMALRYITVLEQASNATQQAEVTTSGMSATMGDFARTIEAPANQLRIFKEQMSQLGTAIGNFIVKPFSVAIAYINGFVMALRTALNFVAKLFGFLGTGADKEIATGSDAMNKQASAIGGVGAAAADAKKKLQDLSAPFDELNVLQEQSNAAGGGGGMGDALDPALAAAIENMGLELENIEMKANKVRDKILEFLGLEIDPATGDPVAIVGGYFDQMVQAWQSQDYNKIGSIVGTMTNQGIYAGIQAISWDNIGAQITAGLSRITGFINGFFATVDWYALGQLCAEGINTMFNTMLVFIQQLDWSQIANAVYLFLRGAFENLDWSNPLIDIAAILFGVGLLGKIGAIVAPLVIEIGQLANAFSALGLSGSAVATAAGTIAGAIATIAGIIAAIVLLYQSSEGFRTSFQGLFTTIQESLAPMFEAIGSLFGTIGESLVTLWSTSIQPMIESVGEALAPVLDTLGVLFEFVAGIVTSVAEMLERVWTSTIEPIFEAACLAIEGVAEIFQNLWEDFISPIVDWIVESFEYLWNQKLAPIVEDIMEIIGGIGELLLNLWNTVLQPLVNFIVNLFGPPIQAVFQAIWTVVEFVIGLIMDIIGTLTGVFSGLIEFLNGVFTGDWKRALSGLLNIFVALANGIIGVFESCVNFVLGILNSFLSAIVGAVKGAINAIGGLVEDIAGFFGFDINLRVNWTAPQIPKLSIPRVPKVALATGGVVTSPTEALIGEGKYDEAVIPLDDSPQMQDLIEKIADAVDKDKPSGGGGPTEVRVFIGGKEYDAFTYKSSERGKTVVGKQPIKRGG